MHIGERYFRYLRHLGATAPVSALTGTGGGTDVIALRHDVDYDLDIAMEMAYWEHAHGARATYYLLHTAAYWHDARFVDKVLQIQDFGHEIGLHLNVLTEWIEGATEHPRAYLEELLARLRSAGIRVTGTSTHGDPACYRHEFINYWCFAELRPADPAATESGLSAEGVPSSDERFRVGYPADHQLRRDDGATFPLWSISMAELGLDHHATHVPYDRYFSDSGGSWKRSPDPLHEDLRRGRHQVLMHPLYWLEDSQRMFFFLSTARSGSKWLTGVLDEATPLVARHEHTLNHRYRDGALRPEKRTADGFVALLDDPREIRRLLIESRLEIEDSGRDYAEANVYLSHTLAQVSDVFPEAVLVHLHRDPAAVVQSLLNRDWYDTPDDDRHPAMDVPGWESMTQLEKACWYVARTNERLMEYRLPRMALEEVSGSPQTLDRMLRSVGIAFFPRLASSFDRVLDATREDRVGAYQAWTRAEQRVFDRICGRVRASLGYGSRTLRIRLLGAAERLRSLIIAQGRHPPVETESTVLLRIPDDDLCPVAHHCDWVTEDDAILLIPTGKGHGHVVWGGGNWHRSSEGQGWQAVIGAHYRLTVQIEFDGPGDIFAYCLMYGETGEQITARRLGAVSAEREARFGFTTRADATRFQVGLYLPVQTAPRRATLQKVRLERRTHA